VVLARLDEILQESADLRVPLNLDRGIAKT
jgi:hypothetical protein